MTMTLKLSVIRWLITLVGVQMLCGIVWILGPLVPPLDTWEARAAVSMAFLLVWAGVNFLLDWRAARREALLMQGLQGAEDEAAAVEARFDSALKLLHSSGRKGRQALQEPPWYVIIGPPGAGKTTALMNAGLEFPLATALGPGAVSGVGGTRLCEWWFTQDGVLIDTAGRYTTQESNRAVDAAGWQTFLQLLKKCRPKQPLNGVLVAIPVTDIAAARPTVVANHVAAIRSRIDELYSTLNIRLPIYVLFTKADLIFGFSEYFDDLNSEGREQVWGTTLPLGAAPNGATLSLVMDPLLERLRARLLQRLDAEQNPDRRAAIAGFPAQFASLLPAVRSFLEQTFVAAADGRAPLLRGAYFTSGTQEGTPIDRLTATLSRNFGLDQRQVTRLRPDSGRAFFLAGLLRDIVFREAMLVAVDPKRMRRQRAAWLAGLVACVAVLGGGSAWLLNEWSQSLAATRHASPKLAAQTAAANRLPLSPVVDSDLQPFLPWLERARIAAAPDVPSGSDPLRFDQAAKLEAGFQAAYRHALDYALLPRLVWRVETVMRGALGDPEALYEATRIYLMLGGRGPLDRSLLQDWFARDWMATYTPGQRTALARHLAALLDQPFPEVGLDGPLVAEARAVFGRVPLATSAYSRLRPLAAAHAPQEWRPSDALGPAGMQVFMRLSGRELNQGVSGLYTPAGLRDAVLPELERAVSRALAESWVVGTPQTSAGDQQTLQREVIGLYAADYIAAWETLLADLDPTPLRSLTQAAQDLFILASSHSPMRALLGSAVKELSPAASLPRDSPAREQMAAVDKHFGRLAALFGTGAAAPIDQVLRPLADLQQQLAKQAASVSRPSPSSFGTDPAVAVRIEALRQPEPLRRWLLAMAASGAALREGGPRGAMIAAWNATSGPGPLCTSVIANRYPFDPASNTDVSIEDFTRLLGPGGAIDAFVNAHLKPYLDTSASPWKVQAVDGVSPPVTAADVAQFQRAAAIRDLFFPNRSAQPVVRFELAPGALDSGVTGARLDWGSVAVVARNAPVRPVALVWPARPPGAAARLTIEEGTPAVVEASGPWSIFRLIATARASSTGERTTLTFRGTTRQARFELRSSPNPLGSTVLADFRCPAVQ